MDIWKYYDITHTGHQICNPTSDEKLSTLVQLVRLPVGGSAVDIACGKGEFLIRLAEAYGTSCVGVDISPHFVAAAKERVKARRVEGKVSVIEAGGADFRPDEPHSFSLASCIGASWIFGGHAGTLDALIDMVEPGGWVIAGEPFWLKEPCDEYLEASGDKPEAFGTHASNVEAGEQRGLDLVYTLVSDKGDWDRYEGLQWYATSEHARTHPEDPDLPELVERVEKARATYLRWGRETLGWAIYVFRRRLAEGERS